MRVRRLSYATGAAAAVVLACALPAAAQDRDPFGPPPDWTRQQEQVIDRKVRESVEMSEQRLMQSIPQILRQTVGADVAARLSAELAPRIAEQATRDAEQRLGPRLEEQVVGKAVEKAVAAAREVAASTQPHPPGGTPDGVEPGGAPDGTAQPLTPPPRVDPTAGKTFIGCINRRATYRDDQRSIVSYGAAEYAAFGKTDFPCVR